MVGFYAVMELLLDCKYRTNSIHLLCVWWPSFYLQATSASTPDL